MKAYKELYGSDVIDPRNGFYHGKRWFNITLAAWKEDIEKGLLTKEELIEDFTDSILKKLNG